MNKKRRRNFNKSDEITVKQILIRSLFSTVIFFLLGIIVLAIISWVFFGMENPTSKIKLIGLISVYISALLTSFFQTRLNGKFYLLSGLTLGAIIFIVSIIFSLIYPINNSFSLENFIWRGLVIIVCVLGGALGVKKRTQKPKRFKRI